MGCFGWCLLALGAVFGVVTCYGGFVCFGCSVGGLSWIVLDLWVWWRLPGHCGCLCVGII